MIETPSRHLGDHALFEALILAELQSRPHLSREGGFAKYGHTQYSVKPLIFRELAFRVDRHVPAWKAFDQLADLSASPKILRLSSPQVSTPEQSHTGDGLGFGVRIDRIDQFSFIKKDGSYRPHIKMPWHTDGDGWRYTYRPGAMSDERITMLEVWTKTFDGVGYSVDAVGRILSRDIDLVLEHLTSMIKNIDESARVFLSHFEPKEGS